MKPMTLKECLSSYYERFSRHRGEDAKARRAFYEFVGASSTAATAWFNGKREPAGGKRWYAVTFFQMLGYNVAEYKAWDTTFQDACKLIAFDLVTMEELALRVGFVGDDVANSLSKVLAGKKKFSAHKLEIFASLVAEKRMLLEDVEAGFLEEYAALVLPVSEPTETEDVVEEDRSEPLAAEIEPTVLLADEQPVELLQMTPEDAALQLALLVQMGIPYAKYLNSDACTPDHRELLRAHAGRNGVFEFNNLLTPLCSERARKKLKGDLS